LKSEEDNGSNKKLSDRDHSKSKTMEEIGKNPLKKSLFCCNLPKFANSSELSHDHDGKASKTNQISHFNSGAGSDKNKLSSVLTINEFEDSRDNIIDIPINTEIVSTGVIILILI